MNIVWLKSYTIYINTYVRTYICLLCARSAWCPHHAHFIALVRFFLLLWSSYEYDFAAFAYVIVIVADAAPAVVAFFSFNSLFDKILLYRRSLHRFFHFFYVIFASLFIISQVKFLIANSRCNLLWQKIFFSFSGHSMRHCNRNGIVKERVCICNYVVKLNDQHDSSAIFE